MVPCSRVFRPRVKLWLTGMADFSRYLKPTKNLRPQSLKSRKGGDSKSFLLQKTVVCKEVLQMLVKSETDMALLLINTICNKQLFFYVFVLNEQIFILWVYTVVINFFSQMKIPNWLCLVYSISQAIIYI